MVTGSRPPPDLLHLINTEVVSIAARKIGSLCRSVRIESLHSAVGATTAYNLYTKQCGEFLDARLRAANSSINTRLRVELCEFYNAAAFELEDVQIQILVGEIGKDLGQTAPSPRWDCARCVLPTAEAQPTATGLV